jgi:spore maturation protein CgeB
MKLCRLTTVYPIYWKAFYTKHPTLENQSYAAQKTQIDYDAFGWADFWSHALTPLGYEVMEINANIQPLQTAWAKENGFTKIGKNWIEQIAFEQVKAFQPDILFMDDYVTFSRDWITHLKQTCSSIRVVLGWCGAPYQDTDVFKAYDLVLSCIPELVQEFRQLGHSSEHLHHAFDPRILERLPKQKTREIPVSFVGQIDRENNKHQTREQLLEYLSSRVPLQIFTPSFQNACWQQDLKTFVKQNLYKLNTRLKQSRVPEKWRSRLPGLTQANKWSSLPVNPVNIRLKSFIHSPVFGLDMFQTLQCSKITLNSHINLSANSASNMRLFEATGAGTCLVTDAKSNLHELFDLGSEVVTYQTPEECVNKLKWLLENEAQRLQITQAGQQKTLASHTFKSRALILDKILHQAMSTT